MSENNKDLSINVRMYRQGLGDCFLLSFKREEKVEYNLLIDCGLLQGTTGSTDIMKEVVTDIQNESLVTGGLDAVAVTHEHWDHISGFSQASDIFENIRFKEVWLGWTEDQNHPQSKPMRERFTKQITGLKNALKKTKERIDRKTAKMSSAGKTEKIEKIKKGPGFYQTAQALMDEFVDENSFNLKGKGRSATWENIIEKSEKRRYCSPKAPVFSPVGLENEIRIYVLGPPEDYAFFTKTEPSKKDAAAETYREDSKFALVESFFASFADESDNLLADACRPFEKDSPSIISHDDFEAPCKDVEEMFSMYFNAENEWRQIDDDWLMMIEPLALHLDSYTNNSCLAFAIELIESGKVLVFPGDAQFGNWISWKDLSWDVRDKNGNITEVKTADLLARTVLYKVGHHGSHNATLREHGLELMNSLELAAMIPVDREKAKSKEWEMPEGHLFERLKEKTQGRIIIADEPDHDGLNERCKKDGDFIKRVKFAETKFTIAGQAITGQPLYVEYEIKN